MNKLMFKILMAEAEAGGGGGETPTTPTTPTTPETPTTPTTSETTTPTETHEEPPKSALEAQTTPTTPTTPETPTTPPTTPETPTKEAPKPTEISDEDFLKGITADDETKKAAGEGNFEISKEMMKNLLPSIREAGLNPEQTNKLANALAREQLSQMKAYREEQMKDMREGNDAAFKAFPEKRDWELMKVARDHFFKPTDEKGNGGTMLHTIATSGLGNDLEFLALLKFAGEKLATDTTPSGGAAGSGKKNVSYAAALGLK